MSNKLVCAFNKPNHLEQLLAASRGTLKQLYRQAQALLAIEGIIQDLTPGKIQVVALQNYILSLTTPSAALATCIKYNQDTLIASLARQEGAIIVKSIRIQVRPDLVAAYKPKTPILTPRRPSAENGRQIAAAAQYIENTALRTALIRLSKQAMPENQANPSACIGMAQNNGHLLSSS